ncbi:hypothetical protein C8R42DRAFT_666218 [Lentinula raphanica]|nr:hypothetical protein C8R42DRAFT_670972 [Lentinula raphanica]KAJ3723417.1 hypothetical protein C8R42DRAFT_666218 [Lentinula raphanica]
MFFSSVSVENTEGLFTALAKMAKSSQGVHPKLGKILKRMFNEVDKVGGAAVGEKRRRTMPRTFKDSNEVTMYMD